MSGVFVSYRRDDTQQICSRVVTRLAEAFGSDAVFFDLDKIHPGQDFLGAITQALSSCEVQVLLIGPGWRRNAKRLRDPSDVVRLEIESALAGALEVIPVLVDHAPFPKARDLPATLHPLLRRNGLQMASGPAFEDDAARLVAAVQARVDAAARQHPPGPWPADRWTALPHPAVEVVLALAQEGGESFAASLLGRRILRRDSGSGRWTTFAALPDARPPKCIAIANPRRGRGLWVGTDGQLLRTEGVLSGWQAHPRFAALGERGVRSIAVDPSDPSRILVGTGRYSSGTSATVATVFGTSAAPVLEEDWTDDIGAGDLHVSRDGGHTWKTGPFRNVNRIVVAPNDPRTVYVATADDGVFVSVNGGAAYMRAAHTGSQTLWSLAVSPHDTATFAIGTEGKGAWISHDRGTSFERLDAGGDVDTLAIAFDSRDSKTMLVCTDKGLYESIDGGATFARADEGLVHWRVVAAQYATTGATLIGTDGGGIYERPARGQRWIRTWTGGERIGCGALAIGSAGAVYVGAGGMLFVTDDDGRTFDALLQLPRSTIRAIAVLADPPPQRGAPRTVGWGREQTVLVGTEDGTIHRSDDYGGHWTCVYRHQSSSGAVRDIVSDHCGVLYAVVQFAHVLESGDRGQSWQALPGLPGHPTAVTVAPQPWHVVLAGTYDTGVFWTRDDGVTWNPLGDGLPERPVMALHLAAASTGLRVVAGLYEGGVYWLEKAVPSWRRATGPGRTSIYDLAGCSQRLIAAADNGVWLSTDVGRRWQRWIDGMHDFEQVTRVGVTARSSCIFAGSNRGVFVRQLASQLATKSSSPRS